VNNNPSWKEIRHNKPPWKRWTVDTWHNVRFAQSSVHTTCGNADGFTENAESGPEVFVSQDYHTPIGMNRTTNYGHQSLTISMH